MSEVSFTKSVKEELATNKYESKDRLRALLAAYIRINGHLVLKDKKTLIVFKTEDVKIAKFIYETILNIYHADTHFSYEKKSKLSKNMVFVTTIEDNVNEILEDLDISFLEEKISKNIVKNDDTISGYLAGAFLASGSINSPKSSNYHLEISLGSENFAKWLVRLFYRYKNTNIEPKIILRRSSYVVYLKKSDKIVDFLVMIGAVSSCMAFEDIRIDRDYSNISNRLVNLDTANMSKTVSNAEKQIMWIKEIDKRIGIEQIHENNLRLLMRLRLENDSASLSELAELMSKSLNKKVSKSNIAHLFKKIEEKYVRLG
ncbi:MAG: DNA-binding protein WhiA [Erysipelotrichaceae bacterium]|jgi:DNA-binding protein WhiA|nr:DNA-binding protein WhiA [Erysipelotrichaceae bacterium]